MKRRKRLKPVSDKRRIQLAQYRKLRLKFLDENPVCQICGKKRSTQVHHANSRVGSHLLEVEHWIAICWEDHDRVHRNPAWARQNGYL